MADNYVRATLAGILLFAIGIAIAAGAFLNYRSESAALDGWERIDGQVVEVVQLAEGKVLPRVAFTADGAIFRFMPRRTVAGRTYKVGDRVVVRYPFAQPDAAQLELTGTPSGRTIYASVGGLLLMLMGGYVAWYARRQGLEGPQIR